MKLPMILLWKGTSARVAPLLKGLREQCSRHAFVLRCPCAYYSARTLFTRCRLQCVTVMNINNQWSPETEQFVTAKISGNALKQGSGTHSVLRQRSSQLQKHMAARMSRRKAVDQNVCGGRGATRLDGVQGKKQVWCPHVRTKVFSEANALYCRKYLWHFVIFPPPPQSFGAPIVIQSPGNCSPSLRPCAAGMADSQGWQFKICKLHNNWECAQNTQENFRFLCGCYMYNYWGQNRYGLVRAVMINPPKLPINDETRNEARIASTCVRRY